MADFDGYVLCGGASRRMGCDKALLEVDGVAMARRVADALAAAGAGRVVAVGGDAAGLTALGLDHVPDRWPGEGPLGGVVTALGHAALPPVAAVLSCDLLRPDPAAIAGLVAEQARRGCDVVVPVVDGHHQWLHAVWRRRAGAVLEDVFRAGERSLAGAAPAVRTCPVAHVGADAVADADRPEDLPDRRTRRRFS